MTSTLWRGKIIFRSLAKFKQHRTQRNNHLQAEYKLGKFHKKTRRNITVETESFNEVTRNEDENKKEAEENHEQQNKACKASTDSLTIRDSEKIDDYSKHNFANISVYYVDELKSNNKHNRMLKPTVIAIGTEIVSGNVMINEKKDISDTSNKENFYELEEIPLKTIKYNNKFDKKCKKYLEEKCPYDEFLQKHNFSLGHPIDDNMFEKEKSKTKISGKQELQEDEREDENKIQSEEDQKNVIELGKTERLHNNSKAMNYLKHDTFNEFSINTPDCIDYKMKDALESKNVISYNINNESENILNNYQTDENELSCNEEANKSRENKVENDLMYLDPQNFYSKKIEIENISEKMPEINNERSVYGEEKEIFTIFSKEESTQTNLKAETPLDDKSTSQCFTKSYNVSENQHLKYFRIFMDSRKYFSTTKSGSSADVSLLVYKGISKRHLKAVISSILEAENEREIAEELSATNEPIFTKTNTEEEKSAIELVDFEESSQNYKDNSEVENNITLYSYRNENDQLNRNSAYERYTPLNLTSRSVPFKSYSEPNMFAELDYKRSFERRLKPNQLKKPSSQSNKRRHKKIKHQKPNRHRGTIISHRKPSFSNSKKIVPDNSRSLEKPRDLTELKHNRPNNSIHPKLTTEVKDIRQMIRTGEINIQEIDKKISEILNPVRIEKTVKVSDYLLNKNRDLGISNEVSDSQKYERITDGSQNDKKISHSNENLSKFIPNKALSGEQIFKTYQLNETEITSGSNREFQAMNDSKKREEELMKDNSNSKKGISFEHDSTDNEPSIHDISNDMISIDPKKKYYDTTNENFYKHYNQSSGKTHLEEQISKNDFRYYIKERADGFDESLKKIKLKIPLPLLTNQNTSFNYLFKNFEKDNEEKKSSGTIVRFEGKQTKKTIPKVLSNFNQTSTKLKFAIPNSNSSNDDKQNNFEGQSYFQNKLSDIPIKKENLNLHPDAKLLKYVGNVKKYIISGIPKSYDFKDLEKFYNKLRASVDNKLSDDQLRNNIFLIIPKRTSRNKLHQSYKLKIKNLGMNSFSEIKSKGKNSNNIDRSLKNYGAAPDRNETQPLSTKILNIRNEVLLSKQSQERRGLDLINKDKVKSVVKNEINKDKVISNRVALLDNYDDKEMDSLRTIKPVIKLSRKNENLFSFKDKFYADVSKHDEDVLTASDVLYKQRKSNNNTEITQINNNLSSEITEKPRIEASKSNIKDQGRFNSYKNWKTSNKINKYNRQKNDKNDLFKESKRITPRSLSENSKITEGNSKAVNIVGSKGNGIYRNLDKQLTIKVTQNKDVGNVEKSSSGYEKSVFRVKKSGINEIQSKASSSEGFAKITSKSSTETPSLKQKSYKPNINSGMNDITKELHLIKTDIINTIKSIDNGKHAVKSVNATDIITNTFKKRLNLLKLGDEKPNASGNLVKSSAKNLNEISFNNKSDKEISYNKKYKTNDPSLKENFSSDDVNFYTDSAEKLKIKIPNNGIKSRKFVSGKKNFNNLKITGLKLGEIQPKKSEIKLDTPSKFKELNRNTNIKFTTDKKNFDNLTLTGLKLGEIQPKKSEVKLDTLSKFKKLKRSSDIKFTTDKKNFDNLKISGLKHGEIQPKKSETKLDTLSKFQKSNIKFMTDKKNFDNFKNTSLKPGDIHHTKSEIKLGTFNKFKKLDRNSSSKFSSDKKNFTYLKKTNQKDGILHSKSQIKLDTISKFKNLNRKSSNNFQKLKMNIKVKNSLKEKTPYKDFSKFSKIPRSREYIMEENIVAMPKIPSKKSLLSSTNFSLSTFMRSDEMIQRNQQKSDKIFGYKPTSKKYIYRYDNTNNNGSKTLLVPKTDYKIKEKFNTLPRTKPKENQSQKNNFFEDIKSKIKTNLTPFKTNGKNEENPKPPTKNFTGNFDENSYKNYDSTMNVGYKIAFSPDSFYQNNPTERSIRDNEMNLRKSSDIMRKIDYNSIQIYRNTYGELKSSYSYSKKYSSEFSASNNRNGTNQYFQERKNIWNP